MTADIFAPPTPHAGSAAAGGYYDPEAGIPRDRWGRPQLPHPETGEQVGWTRASTLAGMLDDVNGLMKWKAAQVVRGIAAAPALAARAAATRGLDPEAQKRELYALAEEAQRRAGSNDASDLGTALHMFTRFYDAGRFAEIPDAFRADLTAYGVLRDYYGIQYEESLTEAFGCCPALMAAGTADRGAYIATGQTWPQILDIKTGKIDGKEISFAVQLATYARRTHLWSKVGKCWQPAPPVDQKIGWILWLPAGKAHAELIEVDLEGGWRLARTAADVRDERKAKGQLFGRRLTVPPPIPPAFAAAAAPEPAVPKPAYCAMCDHDEHRCPGCGTSLLHGQGACVECMITHAPSLDELAKVAAELAPIMTDELRVLGNRRWEELSRGAR